MTTMRRGLTVFLLLALSATGARAERRNVLEGQPFIRHKVELLKSRFEITPQFVTSINQDFRHFIGGGLVLQFHFTEWLAIGVQGAFGGGIDSGITGRLMDVLPDTESGVQPSKQQFRDHLQNINAIFSAYVNLTPIVGKMMLFGALMLKYDMYGMAGVGGMNTTNSYNPANPEEGDPRCMGNDPNQCDPLNSGLKIGGMFGVGVHLFFNDFIGINLELRDFLNSTNPAGLDVNGDRKVTSDDASISNNLFFNVGLTIMLPPTAKISR